MRILENHFGEMEVIVDKSHNYFEVLDDGIAIRKGAVKVEIGELAGIPSNLDGDVVLVHKFNFNFISQIFILLSPYSFLI